MTSESIVDRIYRDNLDILIFLEEKMSHLL